MLHWYQTSRKLLNLHINYLYAIGIRSKSVHTTYNYYSITNYYKEINKKKHQNITFVCTLFIYWLHISLNVDVVLTNF